VKGLRVEGNIVSPKRMRMTLDGDLVPGVQSILILVDALTGESRCELRMAWVDIDLEVEALTS
jgi:hypothetical protein